MSGRIMADPPEQQRPAEPQQPAQPPPRQPPSQPEPPPIAAVEGEPPPPEPAPLSEEAQKRIARLTREKYENIRRAEAAERALEQELLQRQRQQAPQQPNAYGPSDPQEAEQRGYQRAHQDLAAQRFNQACDSLFQKGVAEFGEDTMTDNVRRLQAVGWGAPNDVDALRALEEITTLPHSHKVYAALAADLDNAHRILRLSPNARQMELAMLAHAQNGVATAPPMPAAPATHVSRAPAPLRTISANSQQPDKPLDKLSLREFIQRRDREAPGPSARIRR